MCEGTIGYEPNNHIRESRRRAVSSTYNSRHKKNLASLNSGALVDNDKFNESSRTSIVTSVISSTSSIRSELDKCAKEK